MTNCFFFLLVSKHNLPPSKIDWRQPRLERRDLEVRRNSASRVAESRSRFEEEEEEPQRREAMQQMSPCSPEQWAARRNKRGSRASAVLGSLTGAGDRIRFSFCRFCRFFSFLFPRLYFVGQGGSRMGLFIYCAAYFSPFFPFSFLSVGVATIPRLCTGPLSSLYISYLCFPF